MQNQESRKRRNSENLSEMLALLPLLTGVALSCPDLCRCQARGRVYCNGKNLDTVPYGIPADTEYLYLQNNRIVNSPELNERLSMLPQLERVMLFNNGNVKPNLNITINPS